jgi:hypothetical protein
MVVLQYGFYRSAQEIKKRGVLMRISFKPYAWVLAVAVVTGITGGMARAVSPPAMQDRDHDQDYSKNKRYQQGMREGKDDQANNRDHFKKRHFKKDEDQKAYESGSQKGHAGDHHDDQH